MFLVPHDRIEEYPIKLCNCFTQLRHIDCSYNEITSLPYEVSSEEITKLLTI